MLKTLKNNIAGILAILLILSSTAFGMSYTANQLYGEVSVCAVGCDYSAVETAFSTEGGGKTYIVSGSFSPGADVDIPDGATIEWRDVSLAMDDGYWVHFNDVDDIKMSGYLSITGNGEATTRTLLKAESNVSNVQMLNLKIVINPQYTSAHTGFMYPVYFRLSNSTFNITINDFAANASTALYGFTSWEEFDNNFGYITVKNLTNSQNVATHAIDLHGSFNTIIANTQGTVATGAVTGTGVNLTSGATGSSYTTVIGTSYNNEDNVNNAGTGNNISALVAP